MSVAETALAFGLAALFLAAGLVKFLRPAGNAKDAARWRLRVRFVQAVGILELIAVPLLLWPVTRAPTAIGLACIMLGAVGNALRTRNWHESYHPTATLGLLAWLAVLSW